MINKTHLSYKQAAVKYEINIHTHTNTMQEKITN